jgi:hypothetical protein
MSPLRLLRLREPSGAHGSDFSSDELGDIRSGHGLLMRTNAVAVGGRRTPTLDYRIPRTVVRSSGRLSRSNVNSQAGSVKHVDQTLYLAAQAHTVRDKITAGAAEPSPEHEAVLNWDVERANDALVGAELAKPPNRCRVRRKSRPLALGEAVRVKVFVNYSRTGEYHGDRGDDRVGVDRRWQLIGEVHGGFHSLGARSTERTMRRCALFGSWTAEVPFGGQRATANRALEPLVFDDVRRAALRATSEDHLGTEPTGVVDSRGVECRLNRRP